MVMRVIFPSTFKTAASKPGCLRYIVYILEVVISRSLGDSEISECSMASAICTCLASTSAAWRRERKSPVAIREADGVGGAGGVGLGDGGSFVGGAGTDPAGPAE